MKKFVAMSAIAAMAVMGNAATDAEELAKLKEELSTLKETVTQIKIHDAGDNVKFSVGLRSAIDGIEYKRANGAKDVNPNLMTNRLLLNMAAQPTDNITFKGAISYNKAFGAASQNPVNNNYPQRGYGFDTFDWVINENLTDNTLKLKEAYWVYFGDMFGVPYTASVGRRPSTDGFLTNYREMEPKAKSPLGHVINVEFDGASLNWKLGEATGVDGMSFKLCLGRGLTNARSRFNQDGGFTSYGDYSNDESAIKTVDMYGFIFVPYDDGQYKVNTTYYRGTNVPGFTMMDMSGADTGMTTMDVNSTGDITSFGFNREGLSMKSMGDMTGASVSFQANGIGEFGVSDFLDDTTFFVSYAMSQTHPNNEFTAVDTLGMVDFMKQNNMTFANFVGMPYSTVQGMLQGQGLITKSGMLGSTDSETGTSILVGLVVPAMVTERGKIGIEYNQGSEFWRPFTYGEDTMIGSKLAARGSAFEAYYNQPLVEDILKMQLRYTSIKYDYTGSQGFFGDEGAPIAIDDAKAVGMDPIESATDLRFSITYNY